jgi:hypothetical protein
LSGFELLGERRERGGKRRKRKKGKNARQKFT